MGEAVEVEVEEAGEVEVEEAVEVEVEVEEAVGELRRWRRRRRRWRGGQAAHSMASRAYAVCLSSSALHSSSCSCRVCTIWSHAAVADLQPCTSEP